jgi:hypothetical protein
LTNNPKYAIINTEREEMKMARYKIQGMTNKDYGAMMSGSNDYSIQEFWIETNSKASAYLIAVKHYPELIINTYIQSEEEINEYNAKLQAMEEEEQRKEKEKAERKAKREEEKAKEMGLNIKEYNEYKRLERNKKRHETEMRKHYTAIENAKKGIKYEEKKIKEYEEKMKKITERG